MTSVQEKALFLIDRYEKRFWRVLSLPHWFGYEITPLKGWLKNRIEANQNLKLVIVEKLKNLEAVANGISAIPLRDDFSRIKTNRMLSKYEKSKGPV